MGPGASSGVFEALHNDFRASQLSLSSFSSSDSVNILRQISEDGIFARTTYIICRKWHHSKVLFFSTDPYTNNVKKGKKDQRIGLTKQPSFDKEKEGRDEMQHNFAGLRALVQRHGRKGDMQSFLVFLYNAMFVSFIQSKNISSYATRISCICITNQLTAVILTVPDQLTT